MSRGRLAAALAVCALVGSGGATRLLQPAPDEPVERAPLERRDPALDEDGRRFLATYVEPDGRVVRHDHGGDTVSEGQGYGMLLAVALGDRATFDAVWGWTVQHLLRPDGLLSWRWADGAVVDPEPAADADLDAAWALALAARRWPGGHYADAASTLADAVAEHETATTRAGSTLLAAGPWARGDAASGTPIVVNPSYASPVAEAVLTRGGHADASVSRARTEGSRALVAQLVEARGTPTDWAHVDAWEGSSTPADDPKRSGDGRFGWDAVRVPLRYAASCEPADRSLAASIWPAMRAGAGVDTMGDHPARLVGAAAAAGAAGHVERVPELLDRASASDREQPTYYGSVLTALGRALLTTDVLGGCPVT